MSTTYILSTTRQYHANRCMGVLHTWYKDLGPADHLLFASDLSTGPLFRKYSSSQHKDSQTEKLVRALADVRYWDSDWVFFSCEDVLINTTNMDRFTAGLHPGMTEAFGHMIQAYPLQPDVKYLSGGGGVLMSKQTLQLMPKTPAEFIDSGAVISGIQDVDFSNVMRAVGISLVDHSQFYDQVVTDEPRVKQAIVNHHVAADQMSHVYSLMKGTA